MIKPDAGASSGTEKPPGSSDVIGSHDPVGVASEGWVDLLLPYGAGDDNLFEAVCDLEFRDGEHRAALGAIDQSLAAIVFWVLRHPVGHRAALTLNLELPRGSHDVHILLGFLAQLARLYAAAAVPGSAADFPGSVTVVAMDTAMQRRMEQVRVQRQGLAVYRVRSDRRVVDPDGPILRFDPTARRLLYLNTRVGWPTLPGERNGVVIIDRTSFRNAELLDKALTWARDHDARRIIVLSDQGDQDTAAALGVPGNSGIHWSCPFGIRRALRSVVGPEHSRSRLSTNALLDRGPDALAVTRVDAPTVEGRFKTAYGLLRDAQSLNDSLPWQVTTARRVLNTLRQLVGEVDSFNQSAALDHRARALSSLALLLKGARGDDLPPRWDGFAATRWARLRAVTLELIELIEADNPKFMALLSSLDMARRNLPDHRIVVRVASHAAAAALVDDLLPWDVPGLGDGAVQVMPWTQRLEWTEQPTLEILPGVPPAFRRPALWSAEATERIVIAYGWEERLLGRVLDGEAARLHASLERTFVRLDLGNPPAVAFPPVERFDTVDRQASDTAPPVIVVELDALTADLDTLARLFEDGEDPAPDRSSQGGTARAVPLYLTGGEVWWTAPDGTAEVLAGNGYLRRSLGDLAPGDRLIVPRGTGREGLFARLVEAKYREANVIDLGVLIGRWRRACRALLDKCDNDPAEAKTALRKAGCQTVTQLDAWASGTTIAPQDGEDVHCVAQAAGDEWLERNWVRVAAAATQLRGLHIKLGRHIGGAMSEVANGTGPNLRALAEILGADAADVLDEFDVACLQHVGDATHVPAHLVGTVVRDDR